MKKKLSAVLLCLLPLTSVHAQQTAEDIRRDAAEFEKNVYRENTDEGVAVSLRVGFETTVATAKAKLAEVAEADAALRQRVEAMMTSEEGKLVATDRSAFWEILTLETRPLIQDFELAEYTAAVNAMHSAIQTQRARGTEGAGYSPTVDALFKARSAQVWADNKLAELKRINRVLDSVIDSRPEDAPVPEALPSLREAINQEVATRTRKENQTRQAAESQAREDVQDKVEENAYNAALLAELQRAELRAREMEAILERERIEFEERLRAAEIDNKTKETMATLEHEKELAELKADAERMAAEIRLYEEQQKASTGKIDQEAERTRLVAKAQEPKTQQVLAPFLAEGFWQPGQRRNDIGDEKKPMSWSALVQFGVTKDGDEGLAQLIAVVNDRGFQAQESGARTAQGGNHHDGDRPKLSFGTNWGQIDTSERQKLIEMRALLQELGPTLVELEMLSE